MRNPIFLVFAWVFITSLGCNGSSNGLGGTGQCGSFTSCGGAIVGTWRLTGECVNYPDAGVSTSDAGTSSCSLGQIATNPQLSGTLTFLSNGTYSVTSSMSGSTKFTYTAACMTDVGMTCAQLNSGLAAAADGGVSGSCASTSAGDCTCSESYSKVAGSEEGTYTTSGSSLTMTPSSSSSAPGTTEYCVRGNTLTLRMTDTGSSSPSFIVTATK